MQVKVTITDDDGIVYDGTLDLVKTTKNLKILVSDKPETPQNNEILINIPEDLIEPLLELDERKQIPILWSFSSQAVMVMADFIDVCAEKGFILSQSWLPSAGGHFKAILVKKDKMLTETKLKINGKKTWKLTDVGKIKIRKEISKITKKTN